MNPGSGRRAITVLKDTVLPLPELWMDIYVEGDSSEQRAFAEMFVKARCKRAESPDKADLVVFTGGEDVNPILYGETSIHPSTYYDDKRDELDMKLYLTCLEQGIPMFGVCRGAQFLHVMNGGKLWQDINHHTGNHGIFDVRDKRVIASVSSVHHQACMPNPAGGMEVVAKVVRSTERWANAEIKDTSKESDIEAYFYRDTCCFGVQGHPEYRGYHQYLQWTLEKIYEFAVMNPDISLRDGNCRIKQELLEERNHLAVAKKKGMI